MTYPKCRQLSHCNDDGDGWSLGLGWATKARCQHQSQPSNFLEFSPLQPAFYVHFSVNFEVRKNICIIAAPGRAAGKSSPNIFVLFFGVQRAAASSSCAGGCREPDSGSGSDRFHYEHQTRCHYAIQVTTRQIGVACQEVGRQT